MLRLLVLLPPSCDCTWCAAFCSLEYNDATVWRLFTTLTNSLDFGGPFWLGILHALSAVTVWFVSENGLCVALPKMLLLWIHFLNHRGAQFRRPWASCRDTMASHQLQRRTLPMKVLKWRRTLEVFLYRCFDYDSWSSDALNFSTYTLNRLAPGHHRKARSLFSSFALENGDANRETDDAEKPIRRRQKADVELTAREDNGGSLLARTGQGLAMRPKSGSRADMNSSQQDLLAEWMPSYGDGLHAVKKSSSTPEFQDSDSISIASVWLKSKWNLKPDAFTLTLPLPLFDGIPKPLLNNIPNSIAAWRNKAAED